MDRRYWNRVAENYKSEIFEVFEQDRNQRVLSKLDEYGSRQQTASDIGCGIGDFLPSLAQRFRQVVAVDISWRCIAEAQARCRDLSNISFQTIDLSQQDIQLPEVDFALAVNSIITSSLTQRCRMFEVVSQHLRAKGHLLLVVPSLESVMLSNARLIEWNLRSGVKASVANRAGFESAMEASNKRLHEGIVQINGVPTKHYTQEELTMLLENAGMRIREMFKIEYSWKTEFEDAPRWMKDPYPWDWLCMAQKPG